MNFCGDLLKNIDEYKTIFNKYVCVIILWNNKNKNVDESKINILYNIIYDLLKSNDKNDILLKNYITICKLDLIFAEEE